MTPNRKIADGWLELTPVALRCGIGACPGVYKTPAGKYVVVGRTLSSDEAALALPNRLAAHETAVEIDPRYLEGLG